MGKKDVALFELNESIAKQIIEELLEIAKGKVEVIEVKTNTSRLYKDIEVLFFHQKGSSVFASNRQLTEFKYDFSNGCGVLYERSSVKELKPKLIKVIGPEDILVEKNWV